MCGKPFVAAMVVGSGLSPLPTSGLLSLGKSSNFVKCCCCCCCMLLLLLLLFCPQPGWGGWKYSSNEEEDDDIFELFQHFSLLACFSSPAKIVSHFFCFRREKKIKLDHFHSHTHFYFPACWIAGFGLEKKNFSLFPRARLLLDYFFLFLRPTISSLSKTWDSPSFKEVN